jgi:CHAT domain-containing protein/Flp pilus assembly protein TadD
MIRSLSTVVSLFLILSQSSAQELPKVTEEGKKALTDLLAACEKAGALKLRDEPGTATPRIVVADKEKLQAVIKQQRALLTPALRDSLVHLGAHPGAMSLLLAIGEVTNDLRAKAFAIFFLSRIVEQKQNLPMARQGYAGAAKHFADLGLAGWEALARVNLGGVCKVQGDLGEARKQFDRALALFRQEHGIKHDLVAHTLNDLAAVCHDQGDPIAARRLYEQALALLKDMHGEANPEIATVLSNLAELFRQAGDLPQARTLQERALALRRQLLGSQHPAVAESLNNLATICQQQGESALARQFCQQAMELFTRHYGPEHVSIATTLNNLASIAQSQGNLAEARRRDEQALALFTKLYGKEHPLVATALYNLAEVCREQGELVAARKLHEQGLSLRRRILGPRHAATASSLGALAEVCRDEGDLGEAHRLAEQALTLERQLWGNRHPDVATSLNNLADIYRAEGNLTKARALHEQALALRKSLLGLRHPDVAQLLQNLAMVCDEQRDRAQARRLLVQSLELLEQAQRPKVALVAYGLNNLAVLCLEDGDLAAAQAYWTRALGLLRQLHGDQHPDVALVRSHLALVHARQRLPDTLALLQEATLACRRPGVIEQDLLRLRREDFQAGPTSVTQLHYHGLILESQAETLRPMERACRAAHCYTLAADLLDQLRQDILHSTTSRLAHGVTHAGLIVRRVRVARTLADLTGDPSQVAAAYTAIEQGRARVFLQALGEARARQIGGVSASLSDQEHALHRELDSLDRQLGTEQDRPLAQRDAKLIAALLDQQKEKQTRLDRLITQMEKDYPQYAAWRYPRPCSLALAQASLAEREVAVLFAVDRMESYAVIVRKEPRAGVQVVPLPGSDMLGPKVRTLIDGEVLQRDSRCRALGAALYDQLFKPLLPYVGGADLVVLPDSVLWELPFELLVEGRTADSEGKYLIETRNIRYAPSLTVLHLIDQWEKTRAVPAEPLWALADPIFGPDDSRARGDLGKETRDLLARYALRRSGAGSWRRLPATRAEAAAIARLEGAGSDDVVTDALASEQVVKTASALGILARKHHLHLATHGILGVGLGRQPSLVLSQVGNDGAVQLGGPNDGFLTLEEVTHLRLNADLVVLSACETGKGDLKPAEGVVGLARAFLHAGSRGVVCSLWSVEDERTSTLMLALYQQLKAGNSSAEALAQARRQLITQEEAPFYWAPFILIGK